MAYDELKPLASVLEREPAQAGYRVEQRRRALEWDHNDSTLGFDRGGERVIVSLTTNSGTVCGVTFEVVTPPLPEMRLRTEIDSDRWNKESGVNREVQTGDQAFDSAIYIDSDAPDEEILAVLSSQLVRDAVRSIVGKTHSQLTLNDRKITAHDTKENYVELLRPERALQVVDTLVTLAKAIPRVQPTGRKPSGPGGMILALWCTFAFFSGLGMTIVQGLSYPPIDGWPHLAMLGLGVILAFCMQPLIRVIYKGRSSSSTARMIMTIFAVISMPLFVHGLVFTLNGALDSGKKKVHDVEVVSAEFDSEDKNTNIEVKSWRSVGGKLSFRVSGSWSAKRAKVPVRPGLFWEWRDGDVNPK